MKKSFDRWFCETNKMVKLVLENCPGTLRHNGFLKGIPTGFYDLDYLTQGLQKGNLIMLAGRSFTGKTALALSISRYVVLKENKAVAYFSPRCFGKQIIARLLSMDSEVNIMDITLRKVDKDELCKLKKSAKRIAGSPFYIDDSYCITLNEIKNRCRKLKRRKELGLIVIDSLQFILPNEKYRHFSDDKKKRSIMSRLKKIAVEMDCPVLVVSKLPEPINLEDNRRPEIADIDSSDYSTQYSDVIIFMYQDRSLRHKLQNGYTLTDLIIAKNRSGKDGVLKLKSQFEYSRFVNIV